MTERRRRGQIAVCAAAAGGVVLVGVNGIVRAAEPEPQLPDLQTSCDGPFELHQFSAGPLLDGVTPSMHVETLVRNGVLAKGRPGHTIDASLSSDSRAVVQVLGADGAAVAVALYERDAEGLWVIREAAECVA